MKIISAFLRATMALIVLNTLGQSQMMHQWGDENWGHEDRHFMDWPDSAEVVQVAGIAIVDSSFYMMPHYYLDVDNDQHAEYILGFGPWWYEPESGAVRPTNGQEVTIKGWLHENESEDPAMIAVIEINGLVWRDSSAAPPWSGNWVHRNANHDQFVFCPTDSASWLQFGPGSMMGGHGMMFPDSIFAQFELMHPDSLPGHVDSTCIVGYHTNIADQNRRSMMGGGMSHGMQFRQNIGHQFHLNAEMMAERGIHDHEGIELRYYDESRGWLPMQGGDYDQANMTVDYSGDSISSYYGLFVTGIATDAPHKTLLPDVFSLIQNYPNPFNPRTTIQFTVSDPMRTEMNIYDISGTLVRTLLHEEIAPGTHSIEWDGLDDQGQILSSGIYVIEIQGAGQRATKKLTLLK